MIRTKEKEQVNIFIHKANNINVHITFFYHTQISTHLKFSN